MNTQLGLGCHSVRFTSTVSVSDTGDLQSTVSRWVNGRRGGVSVSDTGYIHSTVSRWVD